MSIEVEPLDYQIEVLSVLKDIRKELKLLNARTEEAFETGIEEVDDE